MFIKVFLMELKDGIRTKDNVIWNIIFPIVLGTLFFGAFSSIYKGQHHSTVKVAVEGENTMIQSVLESVKYDDDTDMFDVITVDGKEGERLLKDEKVVGLIVPDENMDVKVYVKENGIKQSILADVVGQYRQALMGGSRGMAVEKSYAISKGMAGENKDPYISYFYNLIAMISIMGAMSASMCLSTSNPGECMVGIRELASPINKPLYELAKLAATAFFQIITIVIALVYYINILGISFGSDIGYIYVTAILAVIFGQALGFAIAHIYSLKKNQKISVIMLLTLGGGFLSGLYVADMKSVIETKCPIINRINPSTVITDAFYALNIYGPNERYMRSIIYLVVCTVACLTFGLIKARRNQYASL